VIKARAELKTPLVTFRAVVWHTLVSHRTLAAQSDHCETVDPLHADKPVALAPNQAGSPQSSPRSAGTMRRSV